MIWTVAIECSLRSSEQTEYRTFQAVDQHLIKLNVSLPLTWANSIGSGETARMRWLAWTIALRICYNVFFFLMTRLIRFICKLLFFSRTGAIWLGYHEPDPQDYGDIRVWSDCSISAVQSNWDPTSSPSTSAVDSNLCVILDSTTLYWTTAQCNATYGFVCQDEKVTGNVFQRTIVWLRSLIYTNCRCCSCLYEGRSKRTLEITKSRICVIISQYDFPLLQCTFSNAVAVCLSLQNTSFLPGPINSIYDAFIASKLLTTKNGFQIWKQTEVRRG